MPRSLFAVFSFLVLIPTAWAAADSVQLVRVWPGYRDAASFTRLGEYFGGAPDAINQSALRYQPTARGGYYWLIRTDAAQAETGATLELAVIRPGNTTPEIHTFSVNLPAGSHAVNAGLTGRDWTDPASSPVAWQLTLTAADGTPLASAQSFLWTDFASTP